MPAAKLNYSVKCFGKSKFFDCFLDLNIIIINPLAVELALECVCEELALECMKDTKFVKQVALFSEESNKPSNIVC